jgi:hypothetical protein
VISSDARRAYVINGSMKIFAADGSVELIDVETDGSVQRADTASIEAEMQRLSEKWAGEDAD